MNRFAAALWSVFGLVLLSGVFVSDTSAPPALSQRLVCGVLLVPIIVLIVRTLRLAIVATVDGVIVRNWFTTKTLLWSEIDSFGPPEQYGTRRKAGLKIRTRAGHLVTADAYSPGPFNKDGFADDVVSELEAMHSQHVVPPAE